MELKRGDIDEQIYDIQSRLRHLNRGIDPNMDESFISYTYDIVFDIILGIFLGLVVNTIANTVRKIFKLSFTGAIVLQFLLIIIVLYYMKIDSVYLSPAWRGKANYGILFTTVFLAVQLNIIKFFELIYKHEFNTEDG